MREPPATIECLREPAASSASATALPSRPSDVPRYAVAWAVDAAEVREAQALRHAVFVGEMGACLPGSAPGLDCDGLDPFCEHLIVREAGSGAVVGTYRVLTPQQARCAGRLYADAEFDLSRLARLRPRLLELGRSCVHAQHRNGAVIMALWLALGDYVREHRIEAVLGCTSVSLADGGRYAADLYRSLSAGELIHPRFRALPRQPLDLGCSTAPSRAVTPPPLLKGYLRFGAKICGAPARDPEFGVADFLTLLRIADMNDRYASFFYRR